MGDAVPTASPSAPKPHGECGSLHKVKEPDGMRT